MKKHVSKYPQRFILHDSDTYMQEKCMGRIQAKPLILTPISLLTNSVMLLTD